MADTLAEIYRNTLTSSSFDSNGEATIVTTNSSTSHVIKNIQVEDTDATIKVNGTLQVNGFDVVALTGSSSGSEIIAPSSTVKVKSSAIPLNYVDYEFPLQNSGTNYQTHTIATVNGLTTNTNIASTTNALSSSISVDNTRRIFAPSVGTNNYDLICVDNLNATTGMYLYNSSGSVVATNTNSYSPKWFDGFRYVYWYNGSGTAGVDRMDVNDGNITRLVDHNLSNNSTYARFFGYRDEYLFFWSRDDSDTAKVYDFSDGSVVEWTTGTPSNILTDVNRTYYAVKRSGNRYVLLVPEGNNAIRYYHWTKGTSFSGSNNTYTELSLGGSPHNFGDYTCNHAVVGSRLYYINNNNQVAFVDFEEDTPTKGVVGTATLSQSYGRDIQQIERTPSTSTINARSGYPSPSLKLRVTGVTST